MKLSGWGRYPVVEAQTYAPRSADALRSILLSQPNVIARGNGRAYGDSAVNSSATLKMQNLNRMLAFDTQAGQLTVEAGVLLEEVINVFLPRGWFPLVTPGTKFVSIGGIIAADVHGKNHHKDGSFRSCVDWIDVMGADGEITRCSRDSHSALFDHTLGGMGLTGVILRAAIRLRRVDTAWIRQRTLPAPNLTAAMEIFEDTLDSTYSVAWIDCLAKGAALGRSLVMLGEHATLADLPRGQASAPFSTRRKRMLRIPFDFPRMALNRYTSRAFNAVYFRNGVRQSGAQLVDWDSFFYPLDAILNWNRIYGRKGFMQFQCVLPRAASSAGLTELLEATAQAGTGSFLAVLKRLGRQESCFSFPMEGYTLALDFAVTGKTLALLETLDRITVDHGGRFYLAKDARMSPETLRASDRRAEDFQAARTSMGWQQNFQSVQSARLSI